jgi:hypothetical protein
MDCKHLLALLVLGGSAGCATVGSSSPNGAAQRATTETIPMAVADERAPMALDEIGRPLVRRNGHNRVDWAGALGITRNRVRTWPVVRSLRALQPQAFDHLGVTLDRDQVGLTFSTRF